ncbi:MAG TPA: response regulator transcription factor [bacterium]|nr:response regulator transcription factor [bacterium]
MGRTRVLLVDDMGMIRCGIRTMLGTAPDVEVVGEASSGEEAVQLAHELKPDVVLMDQDMPECDGLETTRILKQTMPDIEVVMMTDQLDGGKALQAVEAGATGYVLKDIPAANLAAALRSVCNGRAFIHPEITRKLINDLARMMRGRRDWLTWHQTRALGLTRRQFDILLELVNGSTYVEIADKLTLTEGTVKTHVHNILAKLRCHNRSQLITYVLRNRFIE